MTRRVRIRNPKPMDFNMNELLAAPDDPIYAFIQEHTPEGVLTSVIAGYLNMEVEAVRQHLRLLLRQKKIFYNHAAFRAGKVWAAKELPPIVKGQPKFTRGLVVKVIGGDYKGRVGEIVDIMYAPRPDLYLYQLCFDPTIYMPWKPEQALEVYYGKEGGL